MKKENIITQTALDRAIRACKALQLNGDETREVLRWVDFCDTEGVPYRSNGLTLKIGSFVRTRK